MEWWGTPVNTNSILGVDLHRGFVYCADHSVYLLSNNGRDDCDSWARLIRDTVRMPIPLITHPWVRDLDFDHLYVSSVSSQRLFDTIPDETLCTVISMLSARDAASLSAVSRRMRDCVVSVFIPPMQVEGMLSRAVVLPSPKMYIPLLCRRSPEAANRVVASHDNATAENLDLIVSTGVLTLANLRRVLRSPSVDIRGDALSRVVSCMLAIKNMPGVFEDACIWLARRRVLDRELATISTHPYWSRVNRNTRLHREVLLYGQASTANSIIINPDDSMVNYLVRLRGFDGLAILCSMHLLPCSRINGLAEWACRFPYDSRGFISSLTVSYPTYIIAVKPKLLQILSDVSRKTITSQLAAERNVRACAELREKIAKTSILFNHLN